MTLTLTITVTMPEETGPGELHGLLHNLANLISSQGTSEGVLADVESPQIVAKWVVE